MAAHRGHLGPQDTAHRVLDATDFCSPTHTNQPIATNSHLFSTHRYQLTAASCTAAQQLSGYRRGVPVIGDDEAARQKTTVPVNIEHQIAVDRNAVVANVKVIAEDSSRQLQSRGSMGRRGRGAKAKSNSASRSLRAVTGMPTPSLRATGILTFMSNWTSANVESRYQMPPSSTRSPDAEYAPASQDRSSKL
jgi:hypothetical protein